MTGDGGREGRDTWRRGGGGKRRRGTGRHDSEKRRDIDEFIMIEEEKIESRDGAHDEEDKVEGKNPLSSIFSDKFVIRKFTPNIN